MITPPNNVELRQLNDHFLACNQRFQDMPEQGNGRLCEACDRVLLDFMHMPVNDLVRFQADNDFKHCGSYTHSQVQAIREYLKKEEMPKCAGMGWLVSLAIGAAGLAPMHSMAQEEVKTTHKIAGHELEQMKIIHQDTTCLVYEKGRPDNPTPCIHPKEDLSNDVVQVELLGKEDVTHGQKMTIKGTLIDSVTGESILFANVLLMHGEQQINGAATDFDGHYEITVPVEQWDKYQGALTLNVHCIGYEEKTIPVNEGVVKNEELVVMKDVLIGQQVMLTGIVVCVAGDNSIREKIRFALNPANWYRRVKWKIRNKRGY